jgi:3-hydroxyacyl-[acyl-carrier-protein] dehydratase
MDIKEIMEILPHRYPFLLVDKIESLEPGKKAVGYKNVTMNEQFFQGHFPTEPVMPGVLIIEALAQVGAVALLSMDEYKGKIAYFGGIDKARFKKKVVPGDVLKLEVEIIKMRGPAGIGKAIATVDGKKACEAEILFMVGA